MGTRVACLLSLLAAALLSRAAHAQALPGSPANPAGPSAPPAARAAATTPAPAPAYRIVLRSRHSAAVPHKKKEAQTGGGYIQVLQLEPNAVMFLMRGAVAAGPHCTGSASLQFDLKQDFEILPTRAGVLPPRLSLSAWLIGTLESATCRGGSAEQAEGCACIEAGGAPLLNVCVQPHSVGQGDNLLVNDREGPVEAPACPGPYCLQQSFGLRVVQPCALSHAAAAADFDPEAKLDDRWNEVLKPFRAVPHRDFGFRVIVRVVEDVPPPLVLLPGAAGPRPAPVPTRGKLPLPEEDLQPPRQSPSGYDVDIDGMGTSMKTGKRIDSTSPILERP